MRSVLLLESGKRNTSPWTTQISGESVNVVMSQETDSRARIDGDDLHWQVAPPTPPGQGEGNVG